MHIGNDTTCYHDNENSILQALFLVDGLLIDMMFSSVETNPSSHQQQPVLLPLLFSKLLFCQLLGHPSLTLSYTLNMNNFTLNPMPNFGFDSVAMDYNSMTNNMIDNSMVNTLVVDNSTSNDLMDITEMTQGLVIKDSGVNYLMVVDDSTINSLTANDSMAYTHSTDSSANGFPTANTPVSMGD